ncbi:MAG TPA: alpha/beta hydrolase [Thermomicrobiales bacterium]|jgi:pimeloyl-ACP methyl ester carboxylesterase
MPSATNDGVRIRYEVEGGGPPLLLHIGFVGALEDWDEAGYVAGLRDRFRLVLLDPRGQGQSDKPHDPAAYAARYRVGDVLAVLDAAGIDRAHFWGYSLGGWVGFPLGVLAPDRLASLVIGAAHPFSGNPRPLDGDFFLEGMRGGMAPFVAACEAADPAFFVSTGERARWLAADAEALKAARLNNLTEPDLEPDAVAAIRTPTLLYAGSLDNPEPKAQAARLMPHASFVALDGLDHAQAMNRADLVLPPVLAFLAGHTADMPIVS